MGRFFVVAAELINALRLRGGWTFELLRSLEWKRFESLCAGALEAAGYEVWSTILENEDSINLVISSPNPADGGRRTAVQCRSFDGSVVGTDLVREFANAVEAGGYANGIIICAGAFSPEAIEFAREYADELVLLGGGEFLPRLVSLSKDSRDRLFAEITEGDYTTPTCVGCGKSMVRGVASDGFGGDETWRCLDSGFEECRQTFPLVDLDIPYPPVLEERPPKRGWIFTVRGASGERESITFRDLLARYFGSGRSKAVS